MRDPRRLALLLVALTAAATGCARKGPPTGGPPDLVPPRVVRVAPDSGATAVDRATDIVIEFSEGMDPRSTQLAVDIAPRVDVRARRWSGRRLTVQLAGVLDTGRTYTLFVGSDARDRHGNKLDHGRTVPFSTGAVFPPGVLAGQVVATGFTAPGTYLWIYPDGQQPDSTASDFDAVGVAGEGGAFRVTGLDVPGRYRMWAFADLNANHSYEPDRDLLAPADTLLELTAERPVVDGLQLRVVNPRAQGRIRGAVLDTLGDERGSLRLIAIAESDTGRRIWYELESRGGFEFKWDPGLYRVRAVRDLDRNRIWKRDEEPATEELRVRVPPGGLLDLGTIVLVRPRAAGGTP